MTIQDIRDVTSFKWGTIMATGPISLKLDGDTAALALIPDSLVDPSELVPGDRVRVELSLRKVVIHGKAAASSLRGSTVQRNARFGTPATDAARVALANRKVAWFNTDLGWEESYYAVTGKPGLTALGLEDGSSSGWYPTGFGVTPKVIYKPTASVSTAASTVLGGWSGDTWKNCDTSWFSYSSGTVTIGVDGRYRVRWSTAIQQGAGACDFWMYAGSTFANDAWPLNGSYYDNMTFEFSDVALAAGDTVRAYCVAGVAVVHQSSSTRRGEWLIEYLGPRLVSV